MAIFPVTNEDIEVFSTLINPKRSYSSSSLGTTGSINLFPRNSTIEKETIPLSNFSSSFYHDENLETFRSSVLMKASSVVLGGTFFPSMEEYLKKVNAQLSSAKKQKTINITRFTPTPNFTSNTIRKLNVKDVLMPYYSNLYPSVGWGYTNYNTLNFFSTTGIPTSSVLLYPSANNDSLPIHDGHITSSYALSGAFSFDFHINPKYQVDDIDLGSFKAGTIFHFSSSYALSLITGSLKDENNLPKGFRLQLQLSHSADISPSKAIPGSYPNNLIFLSDDNSLLFNKWHRVVIRWGTNLINDGTGSFNINGSNAGTFDLPLNTIMPKVFKTQSDPRALCVGNYYEGTNTSVSSQELFFSDIISKRDGLTQLIDTNDVSSEPYKYAFNHPLKAEVHELIIRRNYMSNKDILQTSGSGLNKALTTSSIAFYCPPFFTKSSPVRKHIGGSGGVLITPFQEVDGTTDDAFNVGMAFSVAGHYINLENFTKDFANDLHPRLHHLTGTAIDYTTDAESANNILYRNNFIRKRNLTILPCDEGGFNPNYAWITSEDSTKYTDALGRKDESIISLDNLLSTSSLLISKQNNIDYNESFVDELIGASPEEPGLPPGAAFSNYANSSGSVSGFPLTIFQRNKDASSDQVTFFDISNLYFGNKIQPHTFTITDSNISGSNNKVSITLKDNGRGGLYRADATTPHSLWNIVGNIFYDEGVVVIKSPHLYFFGKNQYEISFNGEQYLHSQKYEVLAPAGLLNSSSNPSYANVENSISASLDPLDVDSFVYISNINFHDENLNVIAKAVLAQPVIKRENEKILFKVAFDF